jgi:hypothetical protein
VGAALAAGDCVEQQLLACLTERSRRLAGEPGRGDRTYRWVWHDGTPDGNGPNSTHAFTTLGQRSVAVYFTDSDEHAAAAGHGNTVAGARAAPDPS